MSVVIVHPSIIKGTLQAPPSKSCMQRACAAALLKGGKTIIGNYGKSNDDNAALNIIKQLGASVAIENEQLMIDATNSKFPIPNPQYPIPNSQSPIPNPQSPIPNSPLTINCNESGLSLRMFTPIAALLEQEILLTGEGSLLNRPIDFFGEILPQLNVQVATNNGKLPTTIKGVLQAKNIEIDGSLSSQFLTGLLFAYSSPLAFGNWVEGEANIKVNNLKSKPYIDLTLQVMQDFGLNIPENKDYKEFVFTNQPINQSTNQPVNYSIEGDWSNAAFLLVAGAIAGDITVKGLNINSTQADKAILDVLENIGCNITIASNEITVSCPPLGVGNAFHFDATDCPDLFPPLVALASCCKGVSTITGVTRLQHKESNRANSLQQEFAKMGVEITLDNDTMFIEGTTQIQAATVQSHNDHRIAMACAVAALKANGNIVIEKAEAINKSYPDFFGDLKKVGGVLD